MNAHEIIKPILVALAALALAAHAHAQSLGSAVRHHQFPQAYSDQFSAAPVELTISTGAVTATDYLTTFTVDTESDAATDDLNTITQNANGDTWILLTSANSARDVVLRHAVGNLQLRGQDITLGINGQDWIMLRYYNSAWNLAYSHNAIEDLLALKANESDYVKAANDTTNAGEIVTAVDHRLARARTPGNVNNQALTADVTLVTDPNAALGKRNQEWDPDTNGHEGKLPGSGDEYRIDNISATYSFDIVLTFGGASLGTVLPGEIALCTYVDSAWTVTIVKPNAIAIPLDSGRPFADLDGDGTKDTGEYYIDWTQAPYRENHATSHTLTASDGGHQVHVVTADGVTLTVDAVDSQTSYTIIDHSPSGNAIVDSNASDLIILDGVALDDGDSVDSSGLGGIIIFIYYDATGHIGQSDGWADGGAS